MSSSSSPLSSSSPWASINQLLGENKCWLCQQSFPRGKTKKVFQVYHILQYFEVISKYCIEVTGFDPIETMKSENLRACYQKYISDGGSENIQSIITKMKEECDLDTWMSGLSCSVNESCLNEYAMIVPDNPVSATQRFRNFGISTLKEGDCPPGCGCDNPWAFIK